MKEKNFEEAIKNLEKIVEELEAGDLSLTDAIKKYEEGMKLSHVCTKKLHEIQKKIEVLVRDSSGKLSTEPFSAEHNESTVNPKKNKKSKKKNPEELLF